VEKYHPVVTLFFPTGPDFQQIPENRPILIPQISRVHGKSDPVIVPHVRQALYADDVFSGPFKEFQVIGVVYHTGVVGIFIIDLGFENMGVWLGHMVFPGHGFLILSLIPMQKINQGSGDETTVSSHIKRSSGKDFDRVMFLISSFEIRPLPHHG
jgi:hypothetical protein